MKKQFGFFAIILVSYLLCPPVIMAASFTVDTSADEVDASLGDGICLTASSTCSLRAAVQEANALAGDDDIILPAGTYTLSLVGSDSTAAAGDLDVTSNMTITGDGMASTIIDGNGSVVGENIFYVSAGDTLILSEMKLTGGEGDHSSGGGIYNHGDLTLDSVEVSGNESSGGGGGIRSMSNSNLTITDSIISDNATSDHTGGGILFDGSGSLLISNSTISNNSTTAKSVIASNGGGGLGFYATSSGSSAVISDSTFSANDAGLANGGGISLFSNAKGATVKITNSTVSGNSSDDKGGGIIAHTSNGYVNLMIYSSTITSNTADSGGGLYIYTNSGSNPPEIKNSIMANNTATSGGNDCYGSLTSGGYNFYGDIVDCTITLTTGDQSGDSSGTGVIDPALGALQNNGGNTETHALTATSLAYNAGDPAGCTDPDGVVLDYDQRGTGYSRNIGTACEPGAYEVQPYCGDSMVDSGETCDDGNAIDGDGCTSACVLEYCGDGVVNNAGTEACDDANTTTGDGCDSSCQLEYAPVAMAGADQQVNWPLNVARIRVTVDGTGSYDPDADPLTYSWRFTARPGGSAVTRASLRPSSTASIVSFSPDARGTYTLQLTVTDADGYTSTDSVNVIVN